LAASFSCINGPCFANRPTINQLEDPKFNIQYGTNMLAGLLRKNGDVREALKAYGPMNVGYYYADIVLGLYKNYR
jgi:soluble lytic murein transglycosylase-like protein